MGMTNLKEVWQLWTEASEEKPGAKDGWQDGKPEGEKLEGQKQPPEKLKAYEKPGVTVAKGGPLVPNGEKGNEPSGLNSLEAERTFVPGKDKDAKVMQLKQMQDKLHKLEEELMEVELSNEAFMTPDNGTNIMGRSLFTGAALEPSNGYDRNYCPDPPAPEEMGGPDQDSSAALVAPQQFIPKEQAALAEHIERNRKSRLSKIQG
jgi:hypothetical protein